MSADELGRTGKFPAGSLHQTDEGETRVRIGTRDGAIILDLGTPTAWLRFYPKQAREIARLLIEAAARMEREQH